MDARQAKIDDANDALPSETRAERVGRDSDRAALSAAWREENADAMAAYNGWFDREGHKYLRRPQF